jgi:rfaE bifunctional protein nucleotidyltransferase chain/domain
MRAETGEPPFGPWSLDELVRQRRAWAAAGERVVLTNGCFDLLHAGHVRYLAAARALGDRLVVALNDDAGVRRLKGAGRPLTPLADRAELLAALRAVDAVVPFAGETAVEVLRALAPDVYVKGGDYGERGNRPPEADAAEALGAAVVFVPFTPGRSTSALIERLRGGA